MKNKSIVLEKQNFNKAIIKIDYRFKIVYAIAMLSVISDHCRGKGSIEFNIQGWFNYNSFHMPLFMFSAGYFFKSKNVSHFFRYILIKFKKLIFPIYTYNLFYGFYNQFLKKLGFRGNVRIFSFKIVFIEPLGGNGFKHITPSWFSSTLFFVEVYNITKRKIISLLKIKGHESIYLIIDLIIAYISIIISNKGYNSVSIYIYILRFMHLNIYYELGIYFHYELERSLKIIRNDIYFLCIFVLKLLFHLFYAEPVSFYYGGCQYKNYSPITVIIISILGVAFWIKIGELLEPLLGRNYYVNIIADNTFSIMINHFFALDIIRTIFALISKNTKYCKSFNFHRYYLLFPLYVYIPNKVLQLGIIYYLSCLIIPIIIQKIINKIKYTIFKYKQF